MPKDKKPNTSKSRRRRPNRHSWQPRGMPLRPIDLIDAADSYCQELLSRLRVYEEWARNVDESYNYTALLGHGKQAQKRFSDYMRIQTTIHGYQTAAIDKLMRHTGLIPDNASLLARIWIEHAQRNFASHVDKPAAPDPARETQQSSHNPILDLIMSDFLEKVNRPKPGAQAQNEGAANQEKEPAPDIKTKEGS